MKLLPGKSKPLTDTRKKKLKKVLELILKVMAMNEKSYTSYISNSSLTDFLEHLNIEESRYVIRTLINNTLKTGHLLCELKGMLPVDAYKL
jgi:hypothetical protein